MKSHLKNIILVVLAVSLLLGILTITASATPEPGAEVNTRMESHILRGDGKQIYKLVFDVLSPRGISMISTILSYDNEVIVPVDGTNYVDYNATDGGNFYTQSGGKTTTPIKPLLSDWGFGNPPYGFSALKSYIISNRTAVHIDIFSVFPITEMTSKEDYFEFYFRLADGKGVNDLNIATFRIEEDKTSGSFLRKIYEDAYTDYYGLMVMEVTPEEERIDGNYLKFSYPVSPELILYLEYTNSTEKITPTITTPPTATSITYGQSLVSSELEDGEASVPGTFSWKDPDIVPTVSDSDVTEYDVTFNPSNTTLYKEVSTKITLTVNPLSVPIPVAGEQIYDGNEQAPNIDDSDYYTVTASKQTKAGTYNATVTLKNTTNCKWEDGTTDPKTVSWEIKQKEVTVTGITADDKVYDRSTAATLNYGSLSINDNVDGANLSAMATGTFGDADVGDNKEVTISGITLTGAAKDNYILATSGNQDKTSASISQKTVNVTGITASHKIYDGGISATVVTDAAQFDGILDGDALSVTATGVFADKNVGSGKTVTITYNSLGGASAVNYSIDTDDSQKTATADITAKEVAVTGITADDKVYDKSTAATLSYGSLSIEGKAADDNLSAEATGTFGDVNVGDNKEVAISGITLTGTDAGNYELATSGNQDKTNASISKKPVTITNIIANNKTYDGDSTATVITGGAQFGGLLDGDSLSVTADGEFSDKHVGPGKTVTITYNSLGGASAVNYSIDTDDSQKTATADITAKEVTVTGITADDKVYDRSTAATLNYSGLSINGNVDGANLSVTATGTFGDADVGDNKEVTISDIVLTGEEKNNYSIDTVNSQKTTAADITAKEVTVAGITADNKDYDKSTAATLKYDSLSITGKLDGDDLTATATGTFADADAGVNKDVAISNMKLEGDAKDNYVLATSGHQEDAKATINPAEITGFSTPAPAATIKANDPNNIDAETLKANSITLPATVTINYAAGTEELGITWADATPGFNKKGTTYAYKGTVTHGTNFKPYTTTLDAKLTVTPVKIKTITGAPLTLTLAKTAVESAISLSELGFPTQVTLGFDNGVTSLTVNSAWSQSLGDLQNLASTVSDGNDKDTTVTLINTHFPDWATLDANLSTVSVVITYKLVIPDADIKFKDATITFGEDLNQKATVTGHTEIVDTYEYEGTGGTNYGPSFEEPKDAGTYEVIATVQNDTHKGTKQANLTINKKDLAFDAISAIANQTYTGFDLEPGLEVNDGSIPLDKDVDYTAVYTNNKNAGNNTASVTITGIGNYKSTAAANFTIKPKDIANVSVHLNDTIAIVYNGTEKTPAYTVKDGAVPLTLSTDYTFTKYDNNTVAGRAEIHIAGTGNYAGTAVGHFDIEKATYDMSTVGFADISKTYDGTAQQISISGALPTGEDGISVTVSYSGSATNVSDGSQTITANFTTTSGNYHTPTSMTAELTITPAAITVSGIKANDKTYNGNTVATMDYSAMSLAGKVGSDDVTATATGTFVDKNVGLGKTVTITDLALNGAAASNYTIKGDSQTTTTASITAAEVIVSGITAADKTYDGTTSATVNTTAAIFTGMISGDTLTVSTTGTFADADADTGKTVTFGALILGGADAGNYTVKGDSQKTATATINKAAITVSGIKANDKTYNGNTVATMDYSAMSLAGKVGSDDVTATATGTFDNKDVGTGKTVSLGGYALSGNDAGNYKLADSGHQPTTTADIKQAEITVSGIKANDKTYDGDTKATLDYSGIELTGRVGTEDVTVTATGTFDNKNVSTGKTVTISDLALKGTAAGNYVLAGSGQQTTTIASITAAEVTVSGITAADKTYDGTTSATVNTAAAIFTGKIPTDTLTVSTTGTFADADANTGKTVTFGALILGGADAGNYTVKSDSQRTVTATINKADQPTLTLSIAANVLVGNSITASTTGGAGDGSVTYNVASVTGTGTIAGAIFTANTEGTVTITATKEASTNYNATTSSAVTVTIKNKMDAAASAIDPAKIADGALKASLQNVGRYTVGTPARVSDNVNEFTIAIAGTSALTAYDDGINGEGQWVGVILSGVSVNGVTNTDTTKIYISENGIAPYTALTVADKDEVVDLGGTDGDFVYWMKAEDIGAGKDLYIATDASGANATKITFTYVPKSSSKPAPPVTPPVVEPPVTSGDTTTSAMTVTPQTTGTTSTASVPGETFNDAAGAAAQQAEETGTGTNVTLNVDMPPAATRLELALPTASVRALVAQDEDASLTVATGIGTVTFDGAALAAIGSSAAGPEIIIVAEDLPRHTLTPEQQALVGDRPVIDLYVMSGGKRITDFEGGTATVTIPYELGEGETPEGIVVWYLAEGGKLIEKVCVYDPVTKSVTFVAEHFSEYVVAHFPFTDMRDSQWYYEDVVFAYTHGLMNGTQPTLFSPESNMTRGMIVTILWRMAGEPATGSHGFKDVTYAWYDQAIGWAYANGIVTGYSADRFGPENRITREELAKILRSYAGYEGQVPTDRVLLNSYSDAAAVSDWALPSMEWAVAKGIISGTNRNTLDPGGPALRAQVAAIMQRFMSGR